MDTHPCREAWRTIIPMGMASGVVAASWQPRSCRGPTIPSWSKPLGDGGKPWTTQQRSCPLSSVGSKLCKRACRRWLTSPWRGNLGTGDFCHPCRGPAMRLLREVTMTHGPAGDPMDAISTRQKPIHYPETDGKPVAYTDVQRQPTGSRLELCSPPP